MICLTSHGFNMPITLSQKTFLTSSTYRDENFLPNKRWTGSYLIGLCV